jgi:hypothetical protein
MLGTWGNAAGIYPIRMVLICTVSGVSIHQYTHHGLRPQFFFFRFLGGACASRQLAEKALPPATQAAGCNKKHEYLQQQIYCSLTAIRKQGFGAEDL